MRVFPSTYDVPGGGIVGKYYPGPARRPAEYHGYSSSSNIHWDREFHHQIETRHGGAGTVIIIRGDPPEPEEDEDQQPPSPDAKRHSPAGSASVEYERHADHPRHPGVVHRQQQEKRGYADGPRSVATSPFRRGASSGSKMQQQEIDGDDEMSPIYATPIPRPVAPGVMRTDAPGMAVNYVRTVRVRVLP